MLLVTEPAANAPGGNLRFITQYYSARMLLISQTGPSSQERCGCSNRGPAPSVALFAVLRLHCNVLRFPEGRGLHHGNWQ